MLWWHRCWVLELELETNKLFLESKIDIFKLSLTNGPEMEGIKRMRADFYQFNSHIREAQYLHYLSKVYFNLPEALAS